MSACPSCLLEDCDQQISERQIMMRANLGYTVSCCANEAKRIQENETRKQEGIHADVIAGLSRLAGIPDRFREASLANFKADPDNSIALFTAGDLTGRFAAYEAQGKGIVLLGPRGVGKTHLLCAVLKQLIERGIPCRYIYAADLIDSLRNRYIDELRTLVDQMFRELSNIRVLVLDDIGVSKDSEWTVSQYHQLLDSRYRKKRVTLLASNLGMEDLRGVLGERSMSRLVESNDIVQIRGKDRRMQ